MLLFGKYEHQMDEKKRIRIPAKLKDALGANPVIMKGTSPCLVVYSSERASEVIKAKFEKIIDGTVTDDMRNIFEVALDNGQMIGKRRIGKTLPAILDSVIVSVNRYDSSAAGQNSRRMRAASQSSVKIYAVVLYL